ncbi:hypothetical protein JCGZ_00603 [Jatropha curcas]|uniref:DUF7866 domain-containing protein n=1 Tax=Jatropha curcas TaxID=180498 RepID=A0A067JD91_JATCU|nr:uncharacterized protein LOC105649048 [Jatropha curcas]KDP21816.1 hypothetical protein JCGZ_00603 [Jatropha curcas]
MKVLLLLLLLILQLIDTASGEFHFRPAEPTEYRLINTTELRRRLAEPYQLCLVCKCCAGATTCATMSCCFGIDCQLPNKPYGVCAFVPKTCNCTSCAA